MKSILLLYILVFPRLYIQGEKFKLENILGKTDTFYSTNPISSGKAISEMLHRMELC